MLNAEQEYIRECDVVSKIRLKYSENDELKLINIGIADKENAEYKAYRAYVDECKQPAQ